MISGVLLKIKQAYGFVANPNISVRHNACLQLACMPCWYYFNRPKNLAFHNLCSILDPPKNLQSLLGLGLKFIPTPTHSTANANKSLQRFEKDFFNKSTFAGKPPSQNEVFNPKLYLGSTYIPKWWMITDPIRRRNRNFAQAIASLFQRKRRNPSNLLWHQHIALQKLQQDRRFLIVQCDKNLGPAIIEREIYIQRALSDHLLDNNTYEQLTKEEATNSASKIFDAINDWITKHLKLLNKHE